MTPELKELLQLAAKAAGYEVEWNDAYNFFCMPCGTATAPWRPIEVVDDALRLAFDAELVADFYSCDVLHYDEVTCVDSYPIRWIRGDHAGMCMAIIRAAAEKGRAM